MKIFTLDNVEKSIGDFTLGPLNLEISPGEIVGFVGPNGAGKTTTMRLLTNIYYPDHGKITILGKKVARSSIEWKNEVGHLGEYNSFFGNWTVEKNITTVARFYDSYDVSYALEIADRIDLPVNKKARNLSSGNKQKLALLHVLARRPRLMILDEPLSSIDPLATDDILDLFREHMLNEENAIFFSTHVIAQLQNIADRLIFINDGAIIGDYLTEDLRSSWKRIVVFTNSLPQNLPGLVRQKKSGRDFEVISMNGDETVAALNGRGLVPSSVNRMALDEIALALLQGGK